MGLQRTYSFNSANNQRFVSTAQEDLVSGKKLTDQDLRQIVGRSRDLVLSQISAPNIQQDLLDSAFDLIHKVSEKGYEQESLAALLDISKGFGTTLDSNKVMAFCTFSQTVKNIINNNPRVYNSEMDAEFSKERHLVEGADSRLSSYMDKGISDIRKAVATSAHHQSSCARGTLDVTQCK